MKPVINLISADNGAGLTVDMTMLSQVLGKDDLGATVNRVYFKDPAMPPCDIAIFVERFNPDLFAQAPATIGVFNLEWMDDDVIPFLPRFTQLWAKSQIAVKRLKELGAHSHYTGFLSPDPYDPHVPRTLTCLHAAGNSLTKGTGQVIEAWQRHHEDLPELTVISAWPKGNLWDGPLPPKVTLLGRLPHDELRAHMNTAEIHLCTSRVEGWGHYVAEAALCGAQVVTTDASPMSEHIHPTFGFLLPAKDAGWMRQAPLKDVHPDDIADAVRWAASLSVEQRRRSGSFARSHVLRRNQRSAQTMRQLVTGILMQQRPKHTLPEAPHPRQDAPGGEPSCTSTEKAGSGTRPPRKVFSQQ